MEIAKLKKMEKKILKDLVNHTPVTIVDVTVVIIINPVRAYLARIYPLVLQQVRVGQFSARVDNLRQRAIKEGEVGSCCLRDK